MAKKDLQRQIRKQIVDHAYAERIKPHIPAAGRAMRRAAPIRSGQLRKHTGVTLGKASNDKQAIIWFYSNPTPGAPDYPGHTRSKKQLRNDRGSEYANFTNARGKTAGWFERAVTAATKEFRG